MKSFRLLLVISVFVVLSIPASAVDYRVDPTFTSSLGAQDIVFDLYVQPDGKILVAGEMAVGILGSGHTTPLLQRFHPDGTLDNTFSEQLDPASGQVGSVRSITPLPNGQFLVVGYFHVGQTLTYVVRLNSNGSIDPTLPLTAFNNQVAEPQPDGKLIACGTRVIDGVTYRIGRRLNSNGTIDPTFRITFADTGNCGRVKVLNNGKILMTGEFANGGQPLKRLQLLNSDGSLDTSFDAAITLKDFPDGLTVLADGKILVRTDRVRRLLPNGSLDLRFDNCFGDLFLPLDNGTYFITQCKKWENTVNPFSFARVFSDGTVDPSLDRIVFGGDLRGLRNAGNGQLYVFGSFTLINNVQARKFARLTPDLTSPKARYDFDGDGRSDLAVYRPSDGVWYLNQTIAGIEYRPWGLATDKPLAVDANWDGKTDVSVFRNGQWHALSTAGHQYSCLGAAGDKPMTTVFAEFWERPRDYNLVRGLRSGIPVWFVREGYGNCWISSSQPPAMIVSGEMASDIPVVGDFNGDQRGDIGYFRNGIWFSRDFGTEAPPQSFQWGIAGDIPVAEDYDGDRQTDYAVFRPSTGDWWINRSTEGVFVLRFGTNGDIPVPADYDGDGRVDIAIYRNGAWWQYRMGTGTVHVENWGIAGDIPIPSQSF